MKEKPKSTQTASLQALSTRLSKQFSRLYATATVISRAGLEHEIHAHTCAHCTQLTVHSDWHWKILQNNTVRYMTTITWRQDYHIDVDTQYHYNRCTDSISTAIAQCHHRHQPNYIQHYKI